MIDLHSHLIWDIDDGSESREMTISMLNQAMEGKTRKLVLTPHYLEGFYEENIINVKKICKEIRKIVKEENLDLEIYCGQEIYLTEKTLDFYKFGIIGTINDSRYMLIELNMKNFNLRKSIKAIHNLKRNGIIPVIAHPERYIKFIKNPRIINKYINEGCLFQLNTGSLTGDFGKEVKILARLFVKNKIYSFIGSDAHKDMRRNPNMSKGIEIIGYIDHKYLEYINRSSEKLLENQKIRFIGRRIKIKKLLSYLINRTS